MAISLTGWVVRVTVADQGGNKSTLKFPIDPAALGGGTEYADAAAIRTTILSYLDAVSTAQVVSHSLSEVYDEDTDFYGTGEIENIAQVTAKLVTAGKTANIRVPAPITSLFVALSGPDYNDVDPANVDMQNYLSLFETDVMVSDGEHIRDSATAGNWTGKRIHRGSTRG
jgi:hypothetical protein